MSGVVKRLLRCNPIFDFTCVVFHGPNCADGVASAWCVWCKHPNLKFFTVSSRCDTSQLPLKDENVLFLDVTPKVGAVFSQGVKKLAVLDHHQSAKVECKRWPDHVFVDDTLSAAHLTWIMMNGKKAVPEVLRLIGARDVWRFWNYMDQEVSRAVNNCIGLPVTSESRMHSAFHMISDLERHPIRIQHHTKQQNKQWREMMSWAHFAVGQAKWVHKNEVSMLALSASSVSKPENLSDWDDLASVMLATTPACVVMIIFTAPKNNFHISFRSVENGFGIKSTALAMAKIFGGGGHTHSAGCRTSANTVREMLHAREPQMLFPTEV